MPLYGLNMARIFCSGFELNSLTAGVEWDSITGSPTIQGTTTHAGAYALRCNGSNQYVRKQINNTTLTSLQYLKFNLYIAALPTSGFIEIGGMGTSSARTVTVGLDSNGKLGIYSAGSLQGSVGSTTLETGKWYCIEFLGGYGVSTTRTIRLDESVEVSESFTNTSTWNYIEVGLRGTANSADIYIDDVVHDDSAYPANSGLAILRPNGAGDSTGWTPSTGSNYATVDETPPNDNTDYVSTTTDEAQDLYACTDFAESADSITAVYIGARWKSTNTSFCNIRLQCKEGGSTSTSAELSVTSTNVYQSYNGTTGGGNPIYIHVLTTKPSGGAWTESAVNSMQIGYNVDIVFSHTATVTASWAYVEFVPSAAQNYTQTLTDVVDPVDTLVKAPGKVIANSISLVGTFIKDTSRTLVDALSLTDVFEKILGKTYSETIALSDNFTKQPAKVAIEGLSLVDTFSRQWTLYRTFEEAAVLVDTVAKSIVMGAMVEAVALADSIIKLPGKVLSETATLADSILRQVSRTFTDVVVLVGVLSNQAQKTFSEAVALADTFERAITKVLTETITLVDTIIKDMQTTLSEAVSLTDSLLKQAGRTLTEAVVLVDTFSYKIPQKMLTETIALTATLSNQASRTFAEVVSIADTLIKEGQKVLSEVITLVEELRILRPVNLTEAVALVDSFIKQTSRTLSEVVSLVATILKQGAKVLAEALGLTDTIEKSQSRTLTEVVDPADSLIKQPGKVLSQVITLVDTFSRQATLYRTLSETITLVDTVLKQAQRTLSEAVSLSDTFLRSIGKLASETITLADTVVRDIQHTFTEAVSLVASVLKQNARTLSDALSLSDAQVVFTTGKLLTEAITLADTLVRQVARAFQEAVSLADTVLRSTTRVLSEAVALSDSIFKQLARSLGESTILTDTLTRGATRVLQEAITLGDSIIKQAQAVYSEAVSLSDTILRSLSRVLTDTASLADSVLKQAQRTLSEAVTLVGEVIFPITASVNLLEAITLVDTLVNTFRGLTTKGAQILLTTADKAISVLKSTTSRLLTSKKDRNVLQSKSTDTHKLGTKGRDKTIL